jgi:hypothetical protein
MSGHVFLPAPGEGAARRFRHRSGGNSGRLFLARVLAEIGGWRWPWTIVERDALDYLKAEAAEARGAENAAEFRAAAAEAKARGAEARAARAQVQADALAAVLVARSARDDFRGDPAPGAPAAVAGEGHMGALTPWGTTKS